MILFNDHENIATSQAVALNKEKLAVYTCRDNYPLM